MATFKIKPITPHNLRLHLNAYSFTEPLSYIYKSGTWQRALRLNSKRLIPVEVVINSLVDSSVLTIKVFAKITKQEKNEIATQIKNIFNVNYDLKPAYKIMDSDPVFQKIKLINMDSSPLLSRLFMKRQSILLFNSRFL